MRIPFVKKKKAIHFTNEVRRVSLDKIFNIDRKLTDQRVRGNLHVMCLIADYMTLHPDQRFGQVLFNLGILQHNDDCTGIIDIYNDEPQDIVVRIQSQVRE